MADKVIDSDLIRLRTQMWGQPVTRKNDFPTGGTSGARFSGSSSHNVSAASYGYRIGDVVAVYCDGSTGKPGWSEFIYLQVGTQNAAVVLAAKAICAGDSATNWYSVSNDPDTVLTKTSAPICVALSAMTNAYYGWFWSGGVCPEQFETNLGSTYPTDDSVAAGFICVCDCTADTLGFGAVMVAGTNKNFTEVGYSLAADVTGY